MSQRLIKIVLLGCTALAAEPALAQADAPAAPPANEVAVGDQAGGDIIVTARRRDERLQDVPQAITALNTEQLARKSVVGLADITRVAPSVNITQSAGGGRQIPLFTIRGQRQGDTLSSVDPSVGVYIGDVLFKRTYGLNQLLFDLGTVEVQKGAQGTLFGLNTTGGNIVFRPNLPTDRFEGQLKVGIGNYNDRVVDGFINLPLADWASLRIAGRYEKRDGYIHSTSRSGSMTYVSFRGFPGDATGSGFVTSTAPGTQDQQDLDGGAIRATLKLNPTDRLQSIFTGSYVRSATAGSGFRLTDASAAAPYGYVYSPAQLAQYQADSRALPFYDVYSNVATYARTKPAWDVANTTSYELSDAITLKNVIGYRRYKTENFENMDGIDTGLIDYGTQQNGKEFSEEFQVLGKGDQISWIVGAYYEREHSTNFSFTYSIADNGFGSTPYAPAEDVTNTTKAVFGQATQKLDNILEGLSLTAGGRYTWDTRKAAFGTVSYVGGVRSCSFGPSVTNAPGNPYNYDASSCFVNLKTDFNKFTYALTLDWKVNRDLLLYAAHRKGYRAGGFGTRAVDAQGLTPFRPDEVNDFELGAKYSHSFDNGMFFSTNAAVYKSNYSDIQRLVPRGVPGGVVTDVVNAASATIKGLEIESTFRPVRWFELNGFVSHTDPRYNAFLVPGPVAAVSCTGTPCDVASVADFSGVPRWQYGIGGRVSGELGNVGEGVFSLNWYHQSSYIMQDRSVHQPQGVTPGYGVLNGRIELNEIQGTKLSAAFFMNNITDKQYLVGNYALMSELGFASSLAGAPRMYGFELKYAF